MRAGFPSFAGHMALAAPDRAAPSRVGPPARRAALRAPAQGQQNLRRVRPGGGVGGGGGRDRGQGPTTAGATGECATRKCASLPPHSRAAWRAAPSSDRAAGRGRSGVSRSASRPGRRPARESDHQQHWQLSTKTCVTCDSV